jgi:hypothetical protein
MEVRMRNVVVLLLTFLVLGGCEKITGKPASLEEITKVLDALRTAGCTGLKELDVEREEYEVGGSYAMTGRATILS